MESIVQFLLKANVIFSALFLLYFLLLRKEQSFQLNRLFLIVSIVLPFIVLCTPSLKSVISSITISDAKEQDFNKGNFFFDMYESGLSSGLPSSTVENKNVNENKNEFENSYQFSIIEFFYTIYIFVSVILLLRFIFTIVKLILLLKSGKKEVKEGIVFCYFDRKISPFSFFHYLVINKSEYTPTQLREIVSHEKVHISQWHSLDVILIEIVHCFLWINPLVAFMKRYLKLNLEYIADEKVLDTGINKETYQLTILQNCINPKMLSLANLFHTPKIKQRILMMNSNKSKRRKLYKYAFVLPVIFFANFFFGSFTAKNQRESNTSTISSNPDELKIFEGYYTMQFKKGTDSYIKIYVQDNHLFCKELFSGHEIKFEQLSELEFYNKEKSFPLKFGKDMAGKVTQVLVFEEDLWKKVDTYAPSSKKEVILKSTQLKDLEGYYQSELNSYAVVQVYNTGNKLNIKPLWSEEAMSYTPESDLRFFNSDPETVDAIAFIKDDKEKSVKLMRHLGVWKKIKEYSPVMDIELSQEKLKLFEGTYRGKDGGQNLSLEISAKDGKLFYNELEPGGAKGEFVPVSDSKFISKVKAVSLEFVQDNKNSGSNLLVSYPHKKQYWTKVK